MQNIKCIKLWERWQVPHNLNTRILSVTFADIADLTTPYLQFRGLPKIKGGFSFISLPHPHVSIHSMYPNKNTESKQDQHGPNIVALAVR